MQPPRCSLPPSLPTDLIWGDEVKTRTEEVALAEQDQFTARCLTSITAPHRSDPLDGAIPLWKTRCSAQLFVSQGVQRQRAAGWSVGFTRRTLLGAVRAELLGNTAMPRAVSSERTQRRVPHAGTPAAGHRMRAGLSLQSPT